MAVLLQVRNAARSGADALRRLAVSSGRTVRRPATSGRPRRAATGRTRRAGIRAARQSVTRAAGPAAAVTDLTGRHPARGRLATGRLITGRPTAGRPTTGRVTTGRLSSGPLAPGLEGRTRRRAITATTGQRTGTSYATARIRPAPTTRPGKVPTDVGTRRVRASPTDRQGRPHQCRAGAATARRTPAVVRAMGTDCDLAAARGTATPPSHVMRQAPAPARPTDRRGVAARARPKVTVSRTAYSAQDRRPVTDGPAATAPQAGLNSEAGPAGRAGLAADFSDPVPVQRVPAAPCDQVGTVSRTAAVVRRTVVNETATARLDGYGPGAGRGPDTGFASDGGYHPGGPGQDRSTDRDRGFQPDGSGRRDGGFAEDRSRGPGGGHGQQGGYGRRDDRPEPDGHAGCARAGHSGRAVSGRAVSGGAASRRTVICPTAICPRVLRRLPATARRAATPSQISTAGPMASRRGVTARRTATARSRAMARRTAIVRPTATDPRTATGLLTAMGLRTAMDRLTPTGVRTEAHGMTGASSQLPADQAAVLACMTAADLAEPRPAVRRQGAGQVRVVEATLAPSRQRPVTPMATAEAAGLARPVDSDALTARVPAGRPTTRRHIGAATLPSIRPDTARAGIQRRTSGLVVPPEADALGYYQPDGANRPPGYGPQGQPHEGQRRDADPHASPPGRGRPASRGMPADSGWQEELGPGWNGPDPRYGGEERWAPAGTSGYRQDGPPRPYDYDARDGYAAADEWRRDDYGRYGGGGRAPRDQHDRYDRRDGGQPDPRDRQRGAAAKPVRRIGPPAALPPGPSASHAKPAEHAADGTATAAAAAARGTGGDHAQPGQAPVPAGSVEPGSDRQADPVAEARHGQPAAASGRDAVAADEGLSSAAGAGGTQHFARRGCPASLGRASGRAPARRRRPDRSVRPTVHFAMTGGLVMSPEARRRRARPA